MLVPELAGTAAGLVPELACTVAEREPALGRRSELHRIAVRMPEPELLLELPSGTELCTAELGSGWVWPAELVLAQGRDCTVAGLAQGRQSQLGLEQACTVAGLALELELD